MAELLSQDQPHCTAEVAVRLTGLTEESDLQQSALSMPEHQQQHLSLAKGSAQPEWPPGQEGVGGQPMSKPLETAKSGLSTTSVRRRPLPVRKTRQPGNSVAQRPNTPGRPSAGSTTHSTPLGCLTRAHKASRLRPVRTTSRLPGSSAAPVGHERSADGRTPVVSGHQVQHPLEQPAFQSEPGRAAQQATRPPGRPAASKFAGHLGEQDPARQELPLWGSMLPVWGVPTGQRALPPALANRHAVPTPFVGGRCVRPVRQARGMQHAAVQASVLVNDSAGSAPIPLSSEPSVRLPPQKTSAQHVEVQTEPQELSAPAFEMNPEKLPVAGTQTGQVDCSEEAKEACILLIPAANTKDAGVQVVAMEEGGSVGLRGPAPSRCTDTTEAAVGPSEDGSEGFAGQEKNAGGASGHTKQLEGHARDTASQTVCGIVADRSAQTEHDSLDGRQPPLLKSEQPLVGVEASGRPTEDQAPALNQKQESDSKQGADQLPIKPAAESSAGHLPQGAKVFWQLLIYRLLVPFLPSIESQDTVVALAIICICH